MGAAFHPVSESVLGDAHANGRHACDGSGGLMELVAPLVHFASPVGELFGDELREVIGRVFGTLSYFPEEAPFLIIYRLVRGDRHILSVELDTIPEFGMISSDLNVLWGGSALVFVANLLEILLHHVDIFLVVLLVDPRIANHTDAILVQALGDLHGL